MSLNARKLLVTLTTAGIMGMSLADNPVSHAFDFGDMMNPGRWMGGGRDRNDDYYDYGGPYAGPWGSPYGGGPWGGYGPAPYGGGPYGIPGYRGTVPPPVPTAPTAKAPAAPVAGNSEIDELKWRIKVLESRRQPQSSASPPKDRSAMPPAGDGNSELTFRPMGNE